MLSKKLKRTLALRVKLMACSDACLYSWDKENERLVPADAIRTFGMYHALSACIVFSICQLLRIYIKLNFKGIEDVVPQDSSQKGHEFATMIAAYGEVLIILCIGFILKVMLETKDMFMYLVNQLLEYNQNLAKMIERGELTLTDEHKMILRIGEKTLYLVMYLTLIVPFGILVACTVHFEPCHVMLQEVLEIDLSFKWEHAPLLIVMQVALINCGTTGCLVTLAGSTYFLTNVICINGMTPERIIPKHGKRCKVETIGFGVLEDDEVIKLFRIQQLFHGLMATFFQSLWVTFHQIALLSTVCILLCLVVRFGYILDKEGFLAYVVVGLSLSAPLFVIFYETKMSGIMGDTADGFKDEGNKLLPRQYLLSKFLRSCPTFYLPMTYPFYIMRKDTFLSFCQQALDNTLTLLFW